MDPSKGSPMQSPSRQRLNDRPLPPGTIPMTTADEDATPILIVTQLADAFFDIPAAKKEFEGLFTKYDKFAIFAYLKGFSRARVTFNSSKQASKAKLCLNRSKFYRGSFTLFLYYARPIKIDNSSGNKELMPPQLKRNFLISPPCSPPFGWEQIPEHEPLVNYDLLRALANLNPDEPHEFHKQTGECPSIVVNVCEDPPNYIGNKGEIPHTKCPERDDE